MNWLETQKEIEDSLFPKLNFDSWERMLYYFFLRHTYGEEQPSYRFGIDTLAELVSVSTDTIRKTIRKMDKKGTIRILDRGREGHLIKLVLPSEIPGIIQEEKPRELDLISIDFFSGRKYVANLLKRENYKCFYCLRKIAENSSVLDHVEPIVRDGDNTYKNIVVCCHECNSIKREVSGEVHLREIYRAGLLSPDEFQGRIDALSRLKAGTLLPDL